jgi:tetratricopeptide (TPR) repeat protein
MSRLAAGRAAPSVVGAAVVWAILGTVAAHADARTDCYVKRGDAAIRACTEAIARNSRDVASYISRAYEHYEKGEHALSLADYAKAIEIDPTRWDAYHGRAWVYLKLGKADDALADADAAIKVRPNTAHGLDVRAHALEALGRREEAIADFRRALTIEPRMQGSREGLKRLEKAIGQ